MLAQSAAALGNRSFFLTLRDGPLADILKTPSGYQVQLELPGIKKEDVKVDVQKNVLHVQALKHKLVREGSKLVHSERKYGPISAQFSLPPSVAIEKLEAVLEEGVLTLSIPVAQKEKERVEVKIQ
jgi:HSP20 family protein